MIKVDFTLDQHDSIGIYVITLLIIGKTLDIIFCGGKMLSDGLCLGVLGGVFTFITGSNIAGGNNAKPA